MTKKIKRSHYGIYARYIKRIMDVILSVVALVILSPIILIFTIIGTIQMRGNPFFVQERPGKDGKIFKLVKFRTMTNKKDKQGSLLPDEQRLTAYGKFLRSTSMDELLELYNIAKGDMSIVGPRPLLTKYLPLYNDYQKHRHDVRPGLTGYAQVHGRNAITWEEKFKLDVYYVDHVSFLLDVKIIFRTIKKVFIREGIHGSGTETMEPFRGEANEKG